MFVFGAINIATPILAFGTKNLDADSSSLPLFFRSPSATLDFTEDKFGLGR
jgi:hypothetical protein